MSDLRVDEIRARLTTATVGRNLIYLPQTGSTNEVAKQLAGQGAPEGTLVIADEQTAGKGRLGRRWLAPAGMSLLLSLIFYPNLPPTHLTRCRLPRYQYTACDGRTRLRFLAYSHRLNRTNGLAFLISVLAWLRAFGIETPVIFQTDWGQEFGGDNPVQVADLSTRFLQPLRGQLRRYPLGRKGYVGKSTQE